MSRRERFSPYEKEQACLDYINGNRSRSEICNCLHIFTRTIQDWAAIYKKYGILGFTKKTKNSACPLIQHLTLTVIMTISKKDMMLFRTG